MAEDSGQERTEQPTPRRKQQAKDKGQVARSRELNTMLMMLSSGAGLLFLGPPIVETLTEIFRSSLSISRENVFDPFAMLRLFDSAIMAAFWSILPFFFLVIVAAVIGPVAMGGLTF
ncbi:MAG: EscU/YscU/HrcU family type III secretion system export apparatus switch protein, partial [Gammaproteobacteria bacterium]|nr:EscU/YscU/HrcU family type III secretion system export apparatus switch protein [Gammaproteobacteria bacterium]